MWVSMSKLEKRRYSSLNLIRTLILFLHVFQDTHTVTRCGSGHSYSSSLWLRALILFVRFNQNINLRQNINAFFPYQNSHTILQPQSVPPCDAGHSYNFYMCVRALIHFFNFSQNIYTITTCQDTLAIIQTQPDIHTISNILVFEWK